MSASNFELQVRKLSENRLDAGPHESGPAPETPKRSAEASERVVDEARERRQRLQCLESIQEELQAKKPSSALHKLAKEGGEGLLR